MYEFFFAVKFESSVVLDGTKTRILKTRGSNRFESSVVLDGTKTHSFPFDPSMSFESSVVLDGTKTKCCSTISL